MNLLLDLKNELCYNQLTDMVKNLDWRKTRCQK